MDIRDSRLWNDKRILIVEDDDSSSFLLGEILKPTGAHLSYAFNGREAVDYIRAHPTTDLVLMDIQLPEKDGLTATKEIKAINKRICIIAQSAYTHFVNPEYAGKAGADDYMEKPIIASELLSKIEEAFA